MSKLSKYQKKNAPQYTSGENQTIIETLKFLETGSYHERKEYLKDYNSKGVFLNGFTFLKDAFCYVVSKATDIGTNPEYKGEDLLKAIPRFSAWDKMDAVLQSQPWTYV